MIMIIRLAALAGSAIATLRGLTNVSQTELGERARVAGSQISGYERSKNIPDVDILIRLLHACGWRLAALPARDAETADERAAVVEASRLLRIEARRPGATGLDVAHATDAVVRAADMLIEAEAYAERDQNAPRHVEELVKLRARVDEQRAELESLRLAIQAAAAVLDEAIEAHP